MSSLSAQSTWNFTTRGETGATNARRSSCHPPSVGDPQVMNTSATTSPSPRRTPGAAPISWNRACRRRLERGPALGTVPFGFARAVGVLLAGQAPPVAHADQRRVRDGLSARCVLPAPRADLHVSIVHGARLARSPGDDKHGSPEGLPDLAGRLQRCPALGAVYVNVVAAIGALLAAQTPSQPADEGLLRRYRWGCLSRSSSEWVPGQRRLRNWPLLRCLGGCDAAVTMNLALSSNSGLAATVFFPNDRPWHGRCFRNA